MAYTDKKVNELRNMCQVRKLATSGTKATLIGRLEKFQEYQEEIIIKQETNEMQIDVPVKQQQQEVTASPHVMEASHEVLNGVKNECEPTNDTSQTMETDDFPSKESYLPQQSLEQDMPPNVDMSNEYPQSIDPVEQQQTDQPPTVPSVATSPIVTHDVSVAEVPSSTNDSTEQSNLDKSKPSDSLEKTYSAKYEIDRELLTRFKNLETLRMFSRGITMNQGQANGVPYNYDLLLDIVQKSVIYKDGEIPDCLRYDYDTTYGTTYFGEPECVRNIGILVEELFLHQS